MNKQTVTTERSDPRRLAEGALETLQSGVEEIRHAAPAALTRAAAQVEDVTRRAMERAREARDQMRDQVGRAGDATAGYIRDEPMKSVLVAAAAGAAIAVLIGWLARSSSSRLH